MRLGPIIVALVLLCAAAAAGAATGTLKLEVPGGKDARPPAALWAADGRKAGEVLAGHSIGLAPGRYRLVLEMFGGRIVKDDIVIEAGRTRTVLIGNAAVLGVRVRDRDGKEPGFGVTVTATGAPHRKVAEFISGEAILLAPNQVDVKVDAPPQGYYWHAVTLTPGRSAELKLDEVVPAELVVQPVLANLALDKETRVVIYQAGSQRQVAVSEPAPEHRFKLDPGDYDVYVENHAGRGSRYTVEHGVHLSAGDKVERKVALDRDDKH